MKDENRFNRKWSIVGVSFTTLALSYSVMYSYSVFFVALLKEFGWNRSLTAGAFSSFYILHGLAGPFVGSLVDRFGSRRIFLSGSLFLGIGLALCSLTRSWWQLYLFFGVLTPMGVAATGWVPNTTVIQNSFKEKRGLAMGLISAGIGIGIVICVPSIQQLITRVGWRMAYLIMAIVIPLTIICMVMVFLRTRPQTPRSNPTEKRVIHTQDENLSSVDEKWVPGPLTLQRAISTRPFWLLSTSLFFTSLVTQSILTHQVAFWVDEGLELLFASYVVAMTGMVSIGGQGLLGDIIG